MARPKGRVISAASGTNVPDVLHTAMKVRGYTQKMLAESLGYASQSGVAMMVKSGNMQVSALLTILNALGFDVIVKDRNGSNRENVWKLETVDNDEE